MHDMYIDWNVIVKRIRRNRVFIAMRISVLPVP